ncbi:MAG: FtsX-like permease family protein [Marinibacterium sp.]
MKRTVALALLAHWRRHPGQFLTLLAGLALATALWTAVQAINAEARASYAAASRFLAGAQIGTLTPSGTSGTTIPLSEYVTLRRAGWPVGPVLEGPLAVSGTRVLLTGVDVLADPARAAGLASGSGPDLTDILGPPGRLFAGPQTARDLAGLPGLPPIEVAGDVPPGVAVADISVAERLLGKTGGLTRIVVYDTPRRDMLVPLADLVPDLAFSPAETATDTAGLTRSFHLNLTAFGLLSFGVGLFIVHGTIGLAFEQRRAAMRTLRALGVPLRLLGRIMLGELVALGLLAGGLGVALGYVLATALLPNVALTLRGLYGAEVAGTLALRPGWILAGMAMAMTGVLVAGAQIIWRVRAMPILALAGSEAWRRQNARVLVVQAMLGAGLIVAGAGVVWIWDGLWAGFAFLGGLMVGAALLLPGALALVLRWAALRARGPLAQWVWADMRAQLPGLSLALMALLLALATNVGVGTMVSSFRLTFDDWLDQRLSADLYLRLTTPEQTEEIRQWLQGRADAVLPLRAADTKVDGRAVQVFAIVDDPVYRATWPVISGAPDLWDRIAAGTGVMVNEQLARRQGYWPGTRIELAPGWTEEVVGVYADYGNPKGQAVAPLAPLLRYFPELPDLRLAVRTDTSAELARDLRAAFDLPGDALFAQPAIKARSLAIFERTFVITAALNVLTLGVAAFAILTSLLTLWTLRLPHLAPVWALGLTRAALARLEIVRSLVLAGLTALAALPLGLVLAWALLAVIHVEAFGWRLPLYLFPADWIVLVSLALAAGGLAALIPALKLYRIPPADLLKVFANAR